MAAARGADPAGRGRCAAAVSISATPGYMSRKIRKFRTDKFDTRNKRKFLSHVTHVNGWFPAIYMSYMNENFRLFLVSNLSVLNFRIFSAHVSGVGPLGRCRLTQSAICGARSSDRRLIQPAGRVIGRSVRMCRRRQIISWSALVPVKRSGRGAYESTLTLTADGRINFNEKSQYPICDDTCWLSCQYVQSVAKVSHMQKHRRAHAV